MPTSPRTQPLARLLTGAFLVAALWSTLASGFEPPASQMAMPNAAPAPRVNAPDLSGGAPYTPGIFWLGQVDASHNYADVRVDYNADVLAVVVHIIDRQLWHDPAPTAAALPSWDAVSLYLEQNGNAGSAPDAQAYRFEVEVGNNFQATYRGNGALWVTNSVSLTALTDWRGANGPNSDADSEGWVARFYIPYASLGLAGPPAANTVWGLALVLHDRDSLADLTRHDTLWPATMDPNTPSTWGQLSFGWPASSHPNALPSSIMTIRQGLNGAHVVDGAVGGYTTCGNNGANKWADWGNRNYSSASVNYQFSIQNEWDISDWPCFSKFYITFPLGSLPTGQMLLSATLTMNLLGTAGGGQYGPPPKSFIEAVTVGQDWDPATLTWNNAPPAAENISGSWVNPVIGAYNWDVSRAVDQALAANGPLRLALYSIDGDYHTGKYFFSSESTDWGGTTRPTLTLVFGDPCSAPGITCHFVCLPITWH